jgi:hypothetical protein
VLLLHVQAAVDINPDRGLENPHSSDASGTVERNVLSDIEPPDWLLLHRRLLDTSRPRREPSWCD